MRRRIDRCDRLDGVVLFSLAALVTWMSQFYVRLSRNVLIQEDRDNHWSSQGQAGLGYSFW